LRPTGAFSKPGQILAHARELALAVSLRFFLEPISKSFEEDEEAGELHEAKEVLRIKLPADKNATLPLHPGEERSPMRVSGLASIM
jgi:hypothetical protein